MLTNPRSCHVQARSKAKDQGITNVEFIKADLEALELPLGRFDAILMSSAVPYLSDAVSAFEQFRSWLKLGGRLVLNTPQACAQYIQRNQG